MSYCPCSSSASSETKKPSSGSPLVKGGNKVIKTQTNEDKEFRQNITLSGDCLLKFCIAGTANVGKTSLSRRFVFGVFQDAMKPTIGIDFFTKTLVINGDCVTLQIFDLQGQDMTGKTKSTTNFYYRGSHGIALVTDAVSILSNPTKAKTDIASWKSDIDEKLNNDFEKKPAPVILLVNKMDLPETKDEMNLIEKTAKEMIDNGTIAEYYLVSAKTGALVQESFLDLVQRVRGVTSDG